MANYRYINMQKTLLISLTIFFIISGFKMKVHFRQIKKIVETENVSDLEKQIENGFNINATFRGNLTILHYAIMERKFDFVKVLIEKGADINDQTNDLWTPLYLATSSTWRNDSIAEYLINKGANIEIGAKYGFTPIFNTVSYSNEPNYYIFKLLIDSGANIDISCPKCCNQTLFIRCCYWGTTDMINLLLEKGIDINQVDCKGRNGLTLAIMEGNNNIVEYLLEEGINKNQVDNRGYKPLDYAKNSGRKEIIQMIEK